MKNNNKWSWGDDVISSTDIIARHEELFDEHYDLEEALKSAEKELSDFIAEKDRSDDLEEDINIIEEKLQELHAAVEEAQEALDEFNQSFEKDELDTLTEVIAQGEDAPDWHHGESLIRESYFTQYTQDLIEDTCEVPAEFSSGKWPWTHMNLDYEAAAEELKSDYIEIDVGGNIYYIRG